MAYISRDLWTLLFGKNYVKFIQQQGQPIMDATLNAIQDELRYRLRFSLNALFGQGSYNNGFKPSQSGSPANNFTIKAGDILVNGELINLASDLEFTAQSLLFGSEVTRQVLTTPAGGDRTDDVYIIVRYREIDQTADPDLIDPHVGLKSGRNNIVALKMEWGIRVDEGQLGLGGQVWYNSAYTFLKIGELNRLNSTPNITTPMIDDQRSLETPLQHNQTGSIQGGTITERYHMTLAHSNAVTGANSPSGSNVFATMADLAGMSGQWLPPVQSPTDLPNTANDKDIIFVEDNNSLYGWNAEGADQGEPYHKWYKILDISTEWHDAQHIAAYNSALAITPDVGGNATIGAHMADSSIHGGGGGGGDFYADGHVALTGSLKSSTHNTLDIGAIDKIFNTIYARAYKAYNESDNTQLAGYYYYGIATSASVPAFAFTMAGSSIWAATPTSFEIYQETNMHSKKLTSVADPTSAQDAATQNWVTIKDNAYKYAEITVAASPLLADAATLPNAFALITSGDRHMHVKRGNYLLSADLTSDLGSSLLLTGSGIGTKIYSTSSPRKILTINCNAGKKLHIKDIYFKHLTIVLENVEELEMSGCYVEDCVIRPSLTTRVNLSDIHNNYFIDSYFSGWDYASDNCDVSFCYNTMDFSATTFPIAFECWGHGGEITVMGNTVDGRLATFYGTGDWSRMFFLSVAHNKCCKFIGNTVYAGLSGSTYLHLVEIAGGSAGSNMQFSQNRFFGDNSVRTTYYHAISSSVANYAVMQVNDNYFRDFNVVTGGVVEADHPLVTDASITTIVHDNVYYNCQGAPNTNYYYGGGSATSDTDNVSL